MASSKPTAIVPFSTSDGLRRYHDTRRRAAKTYESIASARRRLRRQQEDLERRFERDMRDDLDRLDDLRYEIRTAQLQAEHVLQRQIRRIEREELARETKNKRVRELVREYRRQVHPQDALAQTQRREALAQVSRMFGVPIQMIEDDRPSNSPSGRRS